MAQPRRRRPAVRAVAVAGVEQPAGPQGRTPSKDARCDGGAPGHTLEDRLQSLDAPFEGGKARPFLRGLLESLPSGEIHSLMRHNGPCEIHHLVRRAAT